MNPSLPPSPDSGVAPEFGCHGDGCENDDDCDCGSRSDNSDEIDAREVWETNDEIDDDWYLGDELSNNCD